MESPSKNKAELLEQLTINRQQTSDDSSISPTSVIVIGLISAIVGAALTYFVAVPSNPKDASQPASKVSEKAVSSRDSAQSSDNASTNNDSESKIASSQSSAESILNASGYITARRMATVSAEIMGLITEVNVEEGMQVNEGQILARLDDTLAKVAVNYAEAQIQTLKAQKASAQATLEEAKRQLKRVTDNQFSSEADRSGAITDLETAQANFDLALANITVAEIEVIRQRERLADHIIRAPFSGVVTVKNAQPGEIVAPSSAGGGFTRTGICTIVDMDSLEIEVDVNESFIGRVYAGQIVEANLDAYPNWDIAASVIAIIPTADRAKATVKVRIKIESSDPRILPDMGVKVAFLKAE